MGRSGISQASAARLHPVLGLHTQVVTLGLQVAWLLILGVPIACVAWTVTHEEVFREPRQYCQRECDRARSILVRKFFYLFTCEYCFSHYVTAGFLLLTRFRLLFQDWWLHPFVLCISLGGESVHQHLQPSAPRYQARAGGDKSRRANGATQGGLAHAS
jgi:hypothetical protein